MENEQTIENKQTVENEQTVENNQVVQNAQTVDNKQVAINEQKKDDKKDKKRKILAGILIPVGMLASAGIATGITIAVMNNNNNTPVEASEEDKAYLAEVNALMQYGKTYASPHSVIVSLKNNGYDVLTHKLSNTNLEFAFDASVKKFIIMYGDKVMACPDGYTMANSQVVFKFTNKYDKDSKYGQYLLDDYVWNDPNVKFEIKASIDVGNNTNIKYMEYVPDNSNSSATRLMRTYCEYLTFTNNNDTIFHMGESNNIEVYGSSSTSLCNYMELGKTSYMYVKDATLQVAKINSADSAQIDVLETEGVVNKGELFHPEVITMLIGNSIEGVEKTVTEITPVKDFGELSQAITDNKKFIRLTDDIHIEDATTSLSINDKSYILDLNRYSIYDEATGLEKGQPLINITATNADSSLMFIDCYRQGSINLNDHYINVLGNSTTQCTATLYLEGANFNYAAYKKRNGAIQLGSIATTSSGKQYSRVYMYGGVINANTDSTTHEYEVAGIYANNDALIQIYYGAIYSSVNCVRTNGIYSGSTINIVDGTFKTGDDVGECVYLPQGKLNISGGTLEGHTCIGIRGGEVNISGGYLHATGEQKDWDKQDTGSGLGGDGSVICAKLCNGSGPNTYGSSLKISITNATLQSKNSYILQVFRNDPTKEPYEIDQYLDVNFISGVYYYGHDVESPKYNGIRISSEVAEDFYTIYQNGGSWIKIDPTL